MTDKFSFDAARPVREVIQPSIREFREEIYPAAMPVILRGVGRDWGLVRAAAGGDGVLTQYLQQYDADGQFDVLTASPQTAGRLFYSDDLRGLNFRRQKMQFCDMLHALADAGSQSNPGTIYLEATPIGQVLPGLQDTNRLEHAPPTIEPRIWIGNSATVQTHFDLSQNIACVASGRRRFTLFPPDQAANLYMGPIENTPSGTPVSMVRLDAVDRARFPRFQIAESRARVANLEPGDAIFIPYMWWHHAQSFGALNILVNYWWNEFDVLGSPMNTLLHAILTLRDLPPPMRDAWKAMFEHFIFGEGGPSAEHIPAELRGGLGDLSPTMRAQLWSMLYAGTSQQADFVNHGPPA